MKPSPKILLSILAISLFCCKKDKVTTPVTRPSDVVEPTYSSVSDFFSMNGVGIQLFTVNAVTGGNFTSTQGTIITVPANAFVKQSGSAVTGNITLQFKDIYSKSDMLLTNMPTMTYWGSPLKSGGEFFLKAIFNDSAVVLAPGKKISVAQPEALTGGLDSINGQQPFVLVQDTFGINSGWGTTSLDSIRYAAGYYVFDMYHFESPLDSGSWCNSDNPGFFSAFPNTTLTVQLDDSTNSYDAQVFLLFSGISSMVHVYRNGLTTYPYYYAPQGLQCTMVAVGVKDGNLYSSFVPVTITSNATVHFTLSATTVGVFVSQLTALN